MLQTLRLAEQMLPCAHHSFRCFWSRSNLARDGSRGRWNGLKAAAGDRRWQTRLHAQHSFLGFLRCFLFRFLFFVSCFHFCVSMAPQLTTGHLQTEACSRQLLATGHGRQTAGPAPGRGVRRSLRSGHGAMYKVDFFVYICLERHLSSHHRSPASSYVLRATGHGRQAAGPAPGRGVRRAMRSGHGAGCGTGC